jgi:hypothetical protein
MKFRVPFQSGKLLQEQGFAGCRRILKILPLLPPPDEEKAVKGTSNPEAILPVERKRT